MYREGEVLSRECYLTMGSAIRDRLNRTAERG